MEADQALRVARAVDVYYKALATDVQDLFADTAGAGTDSERQMALTVAARVLCDVLMSSYPASYQPDLIRAAEPMVKAILANIRRAASPLAVVPVEEEPDSGAAQGSN